MSGRLALLTVVIALFSVLTVLALTDVGYLGIFEPHFQTWGGGQVFADLVIVCTLACIWMLSDARTSGVSAWPFLVITLFLGSFGPLLYLVAREVRAGARRQASA